MENKARELERANERSKETPYIEISDSPAQVGERETAREQDDDKARKNEKERENSKQRPKEFEKSRRKVHQKDGTNRQKDKEKEKSHGLTTSSSCSTLFPPPPHSVHTESKRDVVSGFKIETKDREMERDIKDKSTVTERENERHRRPVVPHAPPQFDVSSHIIPPLFDMQEDERETEKENEMKLDIFISPPTERKHTSNDPLSPSQPYRYGKAERRQREGESSERSTDVNKKRGYLTPPKLPVRPVASPTPKSPLRLELTPPSLSLQRDRPANSPQKVGSIHRDSEVKTGTPPVVSLGIGPPSDTKVRMHGSRSLSPQKDPLLTLTQKPVSLSVINQGENALIIPDLPTSYNVGWTFRFPLSPSRFPLSPSRPALSPSKGILSPNQNILIPNLALSPRKSPSRLALSPPRFPGSPRKKSLSPSRLSSRKPAVSPNRVTAPPTSAQSPPQIRTRRRRKR